ncbi:hypothetical protein HN51_042128 [Arachis hypogaea]|uniref:Copper transport protein n=1 Tax=Arachis hypogaea TaxID=3818 RepID=A0A444YVM4_ARAHY|nr:copper transporter 5 [Arachis hypogaea]QHN87990.1 Copper transporter [Arachis hypogaea]RYR05946.1 hypothetical protein Ahy_B06g085767 [Arachis hypogaea]
MMHMTLYWGKKVTLLFDSWKTESWPSYSMSLLACLVVAALYQYLENRRIRLRLAGERRLAPVAAAIQTPLMGWKISRDKAKLGGKLIGSVLFGVNSGIGYLLMLAIMSFNGGVFVAIVLGLSIGHLLFRSEVFEDDVGGVGDRTCACA